MVQSFKYLLLLIIFNFLYYKLFAQNYKLITQPLYEISFNHSDWFAFYKDGRNVVIDSLGKENYFEEIEFNSPIRILNSQKFIIELKNKKYVLIDRNGKYLSAQYDLIQGIRKDNLTKVYLNKKQGIINGEGKIVIPIIYDNINEKAGADFYFINDKLPVELDKKIYIINKKGEKIYQLADSLKYLYISYDSTFYSQDTLGIPYRFSSKQGLKIIDGPLIWEKNKKYGVFNSFQKKEIIPRLYDYIIDVGYNRYSVLKGDKYALIDKNSRTIFDFGHYKKYGYFKHGIMYVQDKNDRYGYIDTLGKIVIDFEYDKAESFNQNGQAIVSKYGKYALINLAGETITSFKYDEIAKSDLNNELIRVKVDNKWGYITKKGEQITEIKYTKAGEYSKNFAVVGINEKHGMIDGSGKEIVAIEYDWIRKSNSIIGRAIVTKNMKFAEVFDENCLFGILDHKGKIIVPCIYSYINELPSSLYPDLYPDNYYYYKTNNKVGILKCIK